MAYNNFDKQALIAIYSKGLRYFTQVAMGEYFCMQFGVEEESHPIQNEYRCLEVMEERVPVHL